MKRKILAGLAGLIAAPSALLAMVGAGKLLDDGAKDPGISIAMIVFFAGFAAVSAWAGRRQLRLAKVEAEAAEERAVLDLAHTNGGTLSLAEAATHSKLSVDRCKAVMERLAVHGVAEVYFDDSDAVRYRFTGLLSGPAEARPHRQPEAQTQRS